MKFVVGCHARCSSLELKLQESSLLPELKFSFAAKWEEKESKLLTQYGSESKWESHRKKGKTCFDVLIWKYKQNRDIFSDFKPYHAMPEYLLFYAFLSQRIDITF